MTELQSEPGGLLSRATARSRTLGGVIRPSLSAAWHRWLLPLAIVAYVLGATWTWHFPDSRGVPFVAVWGAVAGGGAIVARRLRGRIGPLDATIMIVVAATLLSDVTVLWTQGLRDLFLYLKAGDRWLTGDPVYLTSVMTVRPDDLTNYPFLYPPVTLPLFGALAWLPPIAVAAAWVTASIAAVWLGLRRLGLSAGWAAAFLFWPPVFQGLFVGNVAIPLFLLFAMAPWSGAGLVVAPIFKAYNTIAAVWLVLERRIRDIAVGVAMVVGLLVVTGPVVDSGLWEAWLRGLALYDLSQDALPQYLYGFGLTRWLPPVVVLGFAALGLIAAARVSDSRARLARAGLATVAGSPSLFTHGFLLALPAILGLRTPWLWLALGITSSSPGLAWWLVPLLVAASWVVPALRHDGSNADRHPLGARLSAWPDAPIVARRVAPEAEVDDREGSVPAAA